MYNEEITMRDNIIDMVLTSIVNNADILASIRLDVEQRFKVNLDLQQLERHLSTVQLETKDMTTS